MNESIWATANETLQHFEDFYARYGERKLLVWQTDSGKLIDEVALSELTAQDKVVFIDGYYELA